MLHVAWGDDCGVGTYLIVVWTVTAVYQVLAVFLVLQQLSPIITAVTVLHKSSVVLPVLRVLQYI